MEAMLAGMNCNSFVILWKWYATIILIFSNVILTVFASMQMGACLHEVIYSSHQTANRAISECLYFVREEEDIEDEEDYGGLQRPWVSLFEFTKVFCASPALNFFSWIELWYSLPDMEKGEEHVESYRLH